MRSALACFVPAIVAAFGINGSAFAQDENFTSFRVLKPELSVEAAQAALTECRSRGYQVAVSLTDRFGVLQVTIRDQLAGAHTPEGSFKKAWTAASFRTETSELATLVETGEAWAIRNVSNAMPLGGGIRVISGDGDMVAAIGVSGAPSGAEDEACARAGIAAIEDRISF